MNQAILPRYVMRSAFFAMLLSVIGLWLLQMVFAYLSELENLSDTYTFIDALKFIFYRSPYFLVQFIPTGALLGVVIGLGLLAGNSELVVMRAVGVSKYKIISWAMIPAFLFVVLSLAVNQFILPITNQKALQIRDHHSHDIISIKGYWSVKQQDNATQITYIGYADDKGQLGQIKQYRLADAELAHALSANGGTYDKKNQDDYIWKLLDINEITINKTGVTQSYDTTQMLALPISPTDVHLLTKDADDLSLTDLYAHKQLMTHQKLRSLRHELSFWQKLFSPFAVLSLVLVASSFVFGSLRSQGLGLRIVMALLTGLLFSYLTDLLGFVALAINVSPLAMALLPIMISAGVGAWLLKRQS